MTQLSSARFAGDTWDLACADASGAPALPAQYGLLPIDDDEAPFGEVIYVNAELQGAR
jgi:hypothetical protein